MTSAPRSIVYGLLALAALSGCSATNAGTNEASPSDGGAPASGGAPSTAGNAGSSNGVAGAGAAGAPSGGASGAAGGGVAGTGSAGAAGGGASGGQSGGAGASSAGASGSGGTSGASGAGTSGASGASGSGATSGASGASGAGSAGASGSGGSTGIPVPSGYKLVWSDEFGVDGAPSSANWGYERGLVRNNEAQYYQQQNASVSGGFLVIQARKEQVANAAYQAGSTDWKTKDQYAQYTSSSLITNGKQAGLVLQRRGLGQQVPCLAHGLG